MRLTVLGNNGPYPAPGGACSGYLVESDSGETKILLDCGTGVLSRLTDRISLDELSAVVLSHLHYDHMSDMLPMHYALQFNPRPRPLPVYAPAEPGNVRMLLKGDSIDVWPMRETTVGEMKLSFCPVRHPVEAFAVCVECDGADLLLADAGLPAEKHTESSPHLSAALCGKLARDTHSRRLLLTHLNPKFDASALLREAQEVFPAAELAVCGESWYI